MVEGFHQMHGRFNQVIEYLGVTHTLMLINFDKICRYFSEPTLISLEHILSGVNFLCTMLHIEHLAIFIQPINEKINFAEGCIEDRIPLDLLDPFN